MRCRADETFQKQQQTQRWNLTFFISGVLKKRQRIPSAAKKNSGCCFLSRVADKVVRRDKGQQRGLWEQKGLQNVYTFWRVICIVHREIISTQSASWLDYRDKTGAKWILHSSDGELFIKPNFFPFLKKMSQFNQIHSCKLFQRTVVPNEQQKHIRGLFLHVAKAFIIVSM